ncbi:hypothetical protein [Fischerella sp. PCC 9605]|uniref:hypothetical protein n=1 Tax=Fischerella sp. PCC 9605 TaxID=1173024 RepID=UPI00047EBE4E|nr:hypothetical protein [Fischerella sp. PCC 9605]
MKPVKEGSRFLYCRNCEFKTAHIKTLKSDWGHSCSICQTWQHQSVLATIQQSYAAKQILSGLEDGEIRWCDASLKEFIEAAQALDMEFDYQKTSDGHDFMAWRLDDEERVAKIKI